MFKYIAISLTVALLAVGWWFTTWLLIVAWVGYGAFRLLREGAKGGAF